MIRFQRQYIWKNINLEHIMKCDRPLFFSFSLCYKRALTDFKKLSAQKANLTLKTSQSFRSYLKSYSFFQTIGGGANVPLNDATTNKNLKNIYYFMTNSFFYNL